jgi:Legionella pneumophila major outer membrane protein precursor
MRKLTKLCLLLYAALLATAVSSAAHAQSTDAEILARLNALEKENAALRARVGRLERAKAATTEIHRASVLDSPAPAAPPPPGPVGIKAAAEKPRPHFEIGGSLAFLQPGAGDFQQYAEVANPFPAASPHWANTSIDPKYSPAFDVTLRYMPTASDDVALDWTHLRATDNASVTANSSQFVGPPYSIGPPAAASFMGGTAGGSLQSQYDAVDLTAGHDFCADCPFQFQVFGGVEYARLGETLTGTFTDAATSTFHQYVSSSLFSGAGPRLGIRGQYNIGQFQFFGEAAGAGLIGTAQNNMNFATASPALAAIGIAVNDQSLTSPNATQVVPAFDAKAGTSYTFPISDYGLFKLAVGYHVAVYFDAVTYDELTNVATAPLAGGVYLATDYQHKENLTEQGPYLQGSWLW